MFLKLLFSLLFATSIFAKSITVAAAGNLTFPIQVLKKEFNKLYPDINLKLNFASSGKLTSQIVNGAPFDIFMSANMEYPNTLYKYGIAITKPAIYSQGTLVLFSSKKRDFSKGILLLKDADILKISIANPIKAPYGKAAFEMIENSGILNNVIDKFIYGSSIAEVVTKTLTFTDVGIISKSALYIPRMKKYKKNIHWIEINHQLYNHINQGIVILKHAKGNKEVEYFYNFILSDKAKEVFKSFGYNVL